MMQVPSGWLTNKPQYNTNDYNLIQYNSHTSTQHSSVQFSTVQYNSIDNLELFNHNEIKFILNDLCTHCGLDIKLNTYYKPDTSNVKWM